MRGPTGDDTLREYGAPPEEALVGTYVDSYRVESVVGSGAMGIVYRGVHNVIGKTVAIKVLKPDYADDPEMVQRLIREARTVNAIRHPGIVDIFGFGTLPKSAQPYIVMDLLEGEPLDALIRREAPMTVREAGKILDELLSALQAAHQVGVVHRDLKPGNIFLESQPDGTRRVKVIDFGLARQAETAGGSIRPTNPGTLLGTPAFMAPEQVLGKRLAPSTDLYAVGGIAYQMLTGHLPHEAPSAIEVLSQKMSHTPVRPLQWNTELSFDWDNWVMALLEREIEDRPSSAEEVRRQLRRLLDVRTEGAGPVAKRDTSENRTLLFQPADEFASQLTSTQPEGLKSGPGDSTLLVSPGALPGPGPLGAKTLLHDAPPPVQPIQLRAPVLESASQRPTPPQSGPPQPAQPSAPQSPGPRPAPRRKTQPKPMPALAPAEPPKSRTPLVVALVVAIVLLLAGLGWLLSMR